MFPLIPMWQWLWRKAAFYLRLIISTSLSPHSMARDLAKQAASQYMNQYHLGWCITGVHLFHSALLSYILMIMCWHDTVGSRYTTVTENINHTQFSYKWALWAYNGVYIISIWSNSTVFKCIFIRFTYGYILAVKVTWQVNEYIV